MGDLRAVWLKPGKKPNDPAEEVGVRILGYAHCSFGDTIKPVAIVSLDETGEMKYVELKFLRRSLEAVLEEPTR